jgi:uncharacterized membrane protein YeaQ/YmgE (transglycosylase-associated protein family)
MLGYIWMAFVGLIVGILARFFYPGTVHLNWIWSIVLGIAGAFLAGLVVQLISPSARQRPFHPAGFIASILGAMVLIFLGKHVFHIL